MSKEQPNGTAESPHQPHCQTQIEGAYPHCTCIPGWTAESPRPERCPTCDDYTVCGDEWHGLAASSGVSAARLPVDEAKHLYAEGIQIGQQLATAKIEALTESIQQLQERHDKLKAAFNENEKLTDSLLKSLEERDDTIQQLRERIEQLRITGDGTLQKVHNGAIDDVLKVIGGK